MWRVVCRKHTKCLCYVLWVGNGELFVELTLLYVTLIYVTQCASRKWKVLPYTHVLKYVEFHRHVSVYFCVCVVVHELWQCVSFWHSNIFKNMFFMFVVQVVYFYTRCRRTVSYTHLDVYKRQNYASPIVITQNMCN